MEQVKKEEEKKRKSKMEVRSVVKVLKGKGEEQEKEHLFLLNTVLSSSIFVDYCKQNVSV